MVVILLDRSSRFIMDGKTNTNASKLIKAMNELNLEHQKIQPEGLFGSKAKVIFADKIISSDELDMEFSIPFDDDLIANEAEITIYNLSRDTINKLKKGTKLSVEAGYQKDTGVIFSGFVDKVTTKYEGADKATVIKCFDDVTKKTVESITYKANTKASQILKALLDKTGIPIAVFKVRRDWTYKDEQTVEGDLMENIKTFADVCGISVFVSKGKIYARTLKEGDNINFIINESTGLLGSPEYFEEEVVAEDYKETVTGYKIRSLLQHRMTTAAIINLSSREVNGKYRVRSGTHTFNESEAITEVEVISI